VAWYYVWRVETYFGELDAGLVVIEHAHLVGERVADDEGHRIDRRQYQEVVRPVELLAKANETRVDACAYEHVRNNEQNPF
jgi:hypothetical protein